MAAKRKISLDVEELELDVVQAERILHDLRKALTAAKATKKEQKMRLGRDDERSVIIHLVILPESTS